MPTHDSNPELSPDKNQFEAYLKTFRPRDTGPLQVSKRHYSRRTFAVSGFAVVAVTILLVAGLTIYFRHPREHVTQTTEHTATTQSIATPLTIRSANALLFTSSSFKAAVDEMTFQSSQVPISKDKLSALAELSKEKIKL